MAWEALGGQSADVFLTDSPGASSFHSRVTLTPPEKPLSRVHAVCPAAAVAPTSVSAARAGWSCVLETEGVVKANTSGRRVQKADLR